MTATNPLPFCPCCGNNLGAELPVTIGGLAVDPRGDATWRGRLLGFTAAEHIIFGTIAQARGAIVGAALLAERIGYEGDANVIAVFLVKIRRKLRAAGAPPAIIANVMNRGWRLDLALLAANDAGDRPCR